MSTTLALMFTGLAAISLASKTGALYWLGYGYALAAALQAGRAVQSVRRMTRRPLTALLLMLPAACATGLAVYYLSTDHALRGTAWLVVAGGWVGAVYFQARRS